MSTTNEDVVKILLEALLVDGAHHKQYLIENALRLLCEDFDESKAKLQWKDGIPN